MTKGFDLLRRPGSRGHQALPALRRLRSLRDHGAEILRAPWPIADQLDRGGYIGDLYSEARVIEFARAVYEQALIGYQRIVTRWFSSVAGDLEHWVLLPARLVGYIRPDDRSPRHGMGPTLTGYFDPLPPSEPSRVDITVDRDFDIFSSPDVYGHQRAMRPLAARWIPGTVGGMPLPLGERYPISEIVYRWLADDLKTLGLVRTRITGSPREGLSTWEEREPGET